jgi:hypothetical protein
MSDWRSAQSAPTWRSLNARRAPTTAATLASSVSWYWPHARRGAAGEQSHCGYQRGLWRTLVAIVSDDRDGIDLLTAANGRTGNKRNGRHPGESAQAPNPPISSRFRN